MEEIIESMCLIRTFEKGLEQSFAKGKLRGTMHAAIGQELAPAVLMEEVDKAKDYVFATHRGHGYFLAYSGNPYLLVAEMMGKKTGPVMGAGGSQHIKYKRFYTNGITGGMAPVAVGVALGLKKKDDGSIAVCMLGDGGFNEGYVQEALNLAAVCQAPILFVLENNRYAMSTDSAKVTAGSVERRVRSYDVDYRHIPSEDISLEIAGMRDAVQTVRGGCKPVFLEIDTYRLCGHSKSDECAYMPGTEKAAAEKADPLNRLLAGLEEERRDALLKRAETVVADAFERAEQDGEASLDELIAARKG